MHIVEFGAGTLRFLDHLPAQAPAGGFLWIYLEREHLEQDTPVLQRAAQMIGGSPILDLHLKDLGNRAHPSDYDYTSVYDLVIFRRLATDSEVQAELGHAAPPKEAPLAPFTRIRTRAVGFVVFDRLLITVHPEGCFAARAFILPMASRAALIVARPTAKVTRLPSVTSL